MLTPPPVHQRLHCRAHPPDLWTEGCALVTDASCCKCAGCTVHALAAVWPPEASAFNYDRVYVRIHDTPSYTVSFASCASSIGLLDATGTAKPVTALCAQRSNVHYLTVYRDPWGTTLSEGLMLDEVTVKRGGKQAHTPQLLALDAWFALCMVYHRT